MQGIFRIAVATSVLVASILSGSTAWAQDIDPEERARALHEEALDAYSRMDMNDAGELLEQALAAVEDARVPQRLVAQLHVTYGTVLVLGLGRLADGREHLVTAARAEQGVEPDPMLSTPLLDQLWQDVMAELEPPDEPAPDPPDGPGGDDGPAPTFGQGQVSHEPVIEQLVDHAIPIYIELRQLRDVHRVLLAYRGPSNRSYLTVEMREHGDGMAGRIPCRRVRSPRVEYFIIVRNSEGEEIASVGSEDEPHRVQVVEELDGRAPRLPDRPPEPDCSDDNMSVAETPLRERGRFMYFELGFGTGAGIPFGEEVRVCDAGSDRVRISPSPSWTEVVLAPDIGFYINRHVTLGVRARLQFPGAIFPQAPIEFAVMARVRWFAIPEGPLRVFAHLAAGYGTVSHRIELQSSASSAPVCGPEHYQLAGVGVAQVGAGLIYDLVPNFGLGVEAMASFFLPDFAIQADLVALLHASF